VAYTISQVIAAAQRTFPDLQTTRATDLCNQVHRNILATIPELMRTTLSVTPVSSQQEYSLGETGFQVDHVEYAPASGTDIVVSGTTVEILDKDFPLWRSAAAVGSYTGANVQYYISAASISSVNTKVIGFYPTPGFSTGSFTLYGSFLQASDLTTSSSCLTTLFSSQVYVEGLRYYAATELRPEMAAAYKAAFAEELAAEKMFVRTSNGDIRGPLKNGVNPRAGGYPAEPA
jgi:hypothetical protein